MVMLQSPEGRRTVMQPLPCRRCPCGGPPALIRLRHDLQVLEDHSRPVLSLAIADNKLFSGSYDYTIKVWSLDTLQRLKTLTGAELSSAASFPL